MQPMDRRVRATPAPKLGSCPWQVLQRKTEIEMANLQNVNAMLQLSSIQVAKPCAGLLAMLELPGGKEIDDIN